MKRIVIFQQFLSCGGTESALLDLIKLLNKEKYEVTVFILREGDAWVEKFIQEGVDVRTSWSDIPVAKGFVSKVMTKIKLLDIAHQRKRKSKVWKYALKGKYDLAIIYRVDANWRKMPIKLRDAKTVFYIHGDCKIDDWLKRNIHSRLNEFKSADRVICVSEKAMQSYIEYTGCGENVCTCHNPLDTNRILKMAAVKTERAMEGRYICAVGRLSPEKGFLRLVRIFSDLLSEEVEHKLIIVGEGEEREKLEEIIAERGVGDKVLLAGYQDNPYPYMKNADFIVCSSFTEGLPVIAMESLALGRPIVSSFPSIGELFADEVCGIITETDDESLKAGLRKMLIDQDFYKKACAGAANRQRDLSGERMIKQVEAIYDEVMEA